MKTSKESLPEIMTAAEVAAFLRIKNVDTVMRRARKGQIPGAFQVGPAGLWRFRRDAIEKMGQAKEDGDG